MTTGMSTTDAFIASFSLSYGVDAIVTTDIDYAPVQSLVDIYLPEELAIQAAEYDASID